MPWIFGPAFVGHSNRVDMRELRVFTPIQRAAAFRARMDSYYFDQVKAIASKSPWAPFPLAVMTCIGIETIGAYKYGDDTNDRNGHFKKTVEELDRGFTRVVAAPTGNNVSLSTFVYQGFRNSLAHGFYGKWVFITHDPAKAKTFRYNTHHKLLVLNVYWLYERFHTVAQKYLDNLTCATDPTSDPLLTFEKNFLKNFRLWM
jgi:hypothetical protein